MSVEKKKGAFLPKIGNGFVNEKFGPESILVNVNADGYDAIMKNLQVGSSILLKYNKVTEKGNKHYFCEILPPWKGATSKIPTGKTTGGDLD